MRRVVPLLVSAVLASSMLVGAAGVALASGHDLILPAGTGCAGFDVGVDLGAPRSAHPVWREFHDAAGNVVRTLQAGTGYQLTFTNLTTEASISFASTGAVIHTAIAPDGTQTVSATGHVLLVLYPTDHPAGPSTTVYAGRAVFTVDPFMTFTLRSWSGHRTDVCAALS
jgi:hypothetical protein